jgi:hypothetical protein
VEEVRIQPESRKLEFLRDIKRMKLQQMARTYRVGIQELDQLEPIFGAVVEFCQSERAPGKCKSEGSNRLKAVASAAFSLSRMNPAFAAA